MREGLTKMRRLFDKQNSYERHWHFPTNKWGEPYSERETFMSSTPRPVPNSGSASGKTGGTVVKTPRPKGGGNRGGN